MRARVLRSGALVILGFVLACGQESSGKTSERVGATHACAVPDGADPRVRAAMPRSDIACTRISAPLGAPRDVIQARDGTVFVTEMALGRVVRLEGDAWIPVVTGLVSPIGLREAADGSLIVGEEGAHRVSRLDRATGHRESIAENLGNVTYLTIGPDEAVYVSSFGALQASSGVVHRIPLDAPALATIYGTDLIVPEGLAFDDAGRLIVAEWGRQPSRVVRLPAGGGSAKAAEVVASGFVGAYGVAFVAGSGVLVADVRGDRLSLARADATLETVLSDAAAPAGIWRATNGDILVVEHVDADGHEGLGYLDRLTSL